MKAKEFIVEATMESKVNVIADKLNDEILKTIKSKMTSKRLTMMALKNEEVFFRGIKVKSPSSRVWTRGDGSRYREPGRIGIDDHDVRWYGRKFATFKRLFPTKAAVLEHVWETIKNAPRAKDIGTVSGEFGSDEWSPAVTMGGILWIKRRWSIEYGSPSRLKNKFGVWHNKPPEEPVDEGEAFPSVKTLTPQQLSAKHRVPLEVINKQVDKGTRAEMEHTTDVNTAREIALDHILEMPDYYDKLEKMERE